MGVKLSKAETRSEWDRRPLTPAQLEYARDDVRYLLPMTDKINNLLGRLGRTGWMQEEMGRFSEARTYETAPEDAYLRLRVGRGFTARPTALLRAVAAWRETEAADRDVPARSLLRDEVLLELAQRPPRRLTEFRRLRGFPEVEEVTFGAPLLDALNAAPRPAGRCAARAAVGNRAGRNAPRAGFGRPAVRIWGSAVLGPQPGPGAGADQSGCAGGSTGAGNAAAWRLAARGDWGRAGADCIGPCLGAAASDL